MRALSPAVLRRYVEYLAKHRTQADGQLRAFDNWKRGIPRDAYMDSLLRHTVDAWRMFMDNSSGEGFTDLLCAIIFNASGLLFEQLVEAGAGREKPTPTTPKVEDRRGLDCGDQISHGGTCNGTGVVGSCFSEKDRP
jgi:hypothetical protein